MKNTNMRTYKMKRSATEFGVGDLLIPNPYKGRMRWFFNRGIFCAKCQHPKFKTMIKGKKWACRNCGEIK